VAAATGTAASTAVVPLAVGVYVVVGIVDLIAYTRFQVALSKLGFVILPEPLAVCVGLCHQPSAPTFRQRYPFPEPEPVDPRLLEKWLRRTAPEPGPGPGPVAPPVPKPKPREDEEERRRCRLVRRTRPRGNDPLSELFCSVVSNDAPSYDIYSPVGVAEIDALWGQSWYECKCGQGSLIEAYERGERWAQRALDERDEQIRRQSRIAAYCGYFYRLVVANRRVEEFLRARHADIAVLRQDFEPCE
jgi:hypothetical protein